MSEEPNCNEIRLSLGEAWMMCNECGARLYSFDGYEDKDRRCPYKTGPFGDCVPTQKRRW